MTTFKEYGEARKQRTQRFQKALALVSIISFLGTTVAGTVHLFTGSSEPPVQSTTEASQNIQNKPQLKEQVKGYEMVLQRESDNSTALEGLVQAQIQLNNFSDAIKPLEKLVKIHPARQDYKTILTETKKKANSSAEKSQS